MGCKAIKDYYDLEYVVHVRKEGVCIAGAFITDLIIIGFDGEILKKPSYNPAPQLREFIDAVERDKYLFVILYHKQDKYLSCTTVFTYDGSDIITTFCEIPGWPNITITGVLMYENEYTTDYHQVVEWARNSNERALKYHNENIIRLEKELLEQSDLWKIEAANKLKLEKL